MKSKTILIIPFLLGLAIFAGFQNCSRLKSQSAISGQTLSTVTNEFAVSADANIKHEIFIGPAASGGATDSIFIDYANSTPAKLRTFFSNPDSLTDTSLPPNRPLFDYQNFFQPNGDKIWAEVAEKSQTFVLGAGFLGELKKLDDNNDPRGRIIAKLLARSLIVHKMNIGIGIQGIYYDPALWPIAKNADGSCDPFRQGLRMYADPMNYPNNQTWYSSVLRFWAEIYFAETSSDPALKDEQLRRQKYIMFDNGVRFADVKGYCQPGLSTYDRVRGLKTYFNELQTRLFPYAKMSVTESIDAFEVTAPDGTVYPGRYDGSFPNFPRNMRIEELALALQQNGVESFSMDHGAFIADASLSRQRNSYGYYFTDTSPEGVVPCANGGCDRDYGRVLGVENAIHNRGLRAGLYFTAVPRTGPFGPQPTLSEPQLSSDYIRRVTQMVHEYKTAGGTAELLHFQSWSEQPATIGDENTPGTQWYMIKKQIRAALQQGPIINEPVSSFYFTDPTIDKKLLSYATNGVTTIDPGLYPFVSGAFTYMGTKRALGLPSDIPVVGNYKINPQLTFYRQTTGNFYLSTDNLSCDATYSNIQPIFFGTAIDIPIPFQDTGVDRLAVYRPSLNYYYINNSNQPGFGANVTAINVRKPGDLLLSARRGNSGNIVLEVSLKEEDYLCTETRVYDGATKFFLYVEKLDCNVPTLSQTVRRYLKTGTPWLPR